MKRPTSGGAYVRSKNGSLKKTDGPDPSPETGSVPKVKSKLSSDSETTEEGN
ncbi:hypothetical protein [uncultured Cohaesibacter sp.]|uniref:hypothetical protein n=1 Tax=uncultured Cohaesibacter sp. TaxID=1002546 RepID=UPI0029C7BAD4|nr:hypothetical protein [uncultured Cohaesibacter sp.]